MFWESSIPVHHWQRGGLRSWVTENVTNIAPVPWVYYEPNWAWTLRVSSLNPSLSTLLTCKAASLFWSVIWSGTEDIERWRRYLFRTCQQSCCSPRICCGCLLRIYNMSLAPDIDLNQNQQVGTGVGLVSKWPKLINSFHAMGICLTMVEWLHPSSPTSCCTGAPVPPLASPRQRGRRWPCTRPWQRGVRGSCTQLCQGQIEASQFTGKNINWVLCVTTSSKTSNQEFSYPLYFMHILNSSYSNLKSRSPMLVAQHVATASEKKWVGLVRVPQLCRWVFALFPLVFNGFWRIISLKETLSLALYIILKLSNKKKYFLALLYKPCLAYLHKKYIF